MEVDAIKALCKNMLTSTTMIMENISLILQTSQKNKALSILLPDCLVKVIAKFNLKSLQM